MSDLCLTLTQIKVINKKQYRLVYEDIMKHLDRMENEYLPQVVLSTTDVSSLVNSLAMSAC